jgi:hypothetical protein
LEFAGTISPDARRRYLGFATALTNFRPQTEIDPAVIIATHFIAAHPPDAGQSGFGMKRGLRFAPVAGLDIKLDPTLGAHAHQQLLQGVGALVAGVEPLL